MEEKSVGAKNCLGLARRRNSAASTVPLPESEMKTAFCGGTALCSAEYSPNGEPARIFGSNHICDNHEAIIEMVTNDVAPTQNITK